MIKTWQRMKYPDANYFEPLFFEALDHFTKLMEAYQVGEEDK
jgi:hypothetical protein